MSSSMRFIEDKSNVPSRFDRLNSFSFDCNSGLTRLISFGVLSLSETFTCARGSTSSFSSVYGMSRNIDGGSVIGCLTADGTAVSFVCSTIGFRLIDLMEMRSPDENGADEESLTFSCSLMRARTSFASLWFADLYDEVNFLVRDQKRCSSRPLHRSLPLFAKDK